MKNPVSALIFSENDRAMRKKPKSIPVNNFGGEFDLGIIIERISFKDLPNLQEWNQPERHDRNSFFLLERGSVTIEIDFTRHSIQSPSLIYMHPDQVHRVIAFENVTVVAWAINNEHLRQEYLKMLKDITPAPPLALGQETHSLVSEAISLCLKFYERRDIQLYFPLMKDSCNALIAFAISLFTGQSKQSDKQSRSEQVTNAFREILEREFSQLKRPTGYARILNLSAPYLNECVRKTTGFSVTHQIQQRVVLEAKRLLYHSDHSLKEIATILGYDDYPYFSRLFTQVAGIAPTNFRRKNLDSSKPYTG